MPAKQTSLPWKRYVAAVLVVAAGFVSGIAGLCCIIGQILSWCFTGHSVPLSLGSLARLSPPTPTTGAQSGFAQISHFLLSLPAPFTLLVAAPTLAALGFAWAGRLRSKAATIKAETSPDQ